MINDEHSKSSEFEEAWKWFIHLVKSKGKLNVIKLEFYEDFINTLTTQEAIDSLKYSTNKGFVTLYKIQKNEINKGTIGDKPGRIGDNSKQTDRSKLTRSI